MYLDIGKTVFVEAKYDFRFAEIKNSAYVNKLTFRERR
jgi:hypothetical protein